MSLNIDIEGTLSWKAFNLLFADAVQREKSAGFVGKIAPAARKFLSTALNTVRNATNKAKTVTADDIKNGLIGAGTAASTGYIINKHILNGANAKPVSTRVMPPNNNTGAAPAGLRALATGNDQKAQKVFEARTGGSLHDLWWSKWKDFVPGKLMMQGTGEYLTDKLQPSDADLWGRMNAQKLL